MKCPLCGKNTYRYHASYLGFEIMKCNSCGFESSARTPEKFNLDVFSFKKRGR